MNYKTLNLSSFENVLIYQKSFLVHMLNPNLGKIVSFSLNNVDLISKKK